MLIILNIRPSCGFFSGFSLSVLELSSLLTFWSSFFGFLLAIPARYTNVYFKNIYRRIGFWCYCQVWNWNSRIFSIQEISLIFLKLVIVIVSYLPVMKETKSWCFYWGNNFISGNYFELHCSCCWIENFNFLMCNITSLPQLEIILNNCIISICQ